MPYVVRHLLRMDLTFFAAHSKVITGRRRGINVDAWIVHYLAIKMPATLTIRYRHVDTGQITTETRPFSKLQKNVRLHGRMVQGDGYERFAAGDIMLLHFGIASLRGTSSRMKATSGPSSRSSTTPRT